MAIALDIVSLLSVVCMIALIACIASTHKDREGTVENVVSINHKDGNLIVNTMNGTKEIYTDEYEMNGSNLTYVYSESVPLIGDNYTRLWIFGISIIVSISVILLAIKDTEIFDRKR